MDELDPTIDKTNCWACEGPLQDGWEQEIGYCQRCNLGIRARIIRDRWILRFGIVAYVLGVTFLFSKAKNTVSTLDNMRYLLIFSIVFLLLVRWYQWLNRLIWTHTPPPEHH